MIITEAEIERIRDWSRQEVTRATNEWPELEISPEQLEAIVRFSGASCVNCGQELDLNADPMPQLVRLNEEEPMTIDNLAFAHTDETVCEKYLEEG